MYAQAHIVYGWVFPDDFQEEMEKVVEKQEEHPLVSYYVPEPEDEGYWMLEEYGWDKICTEDSFFCEDGANENYVESAYSGSGWPPVWIGYSKGVIAGFDLKGNETAREPREEEIEEFNRQVAELKPEWVEYLRERLGEPKLGIAWGTS